MTIHQQIFNRLKEVARNGDLITYGEIAPLANLNMQNPIDRNKIAQILGDISTYEIENGRPMLSAIVVLAHDGHPGAGFYNLARELGRLDGGQDLDELEFFSQEVKKIHEYWKNHSE